MKIIFYPILYLFLSIFINFSYAQESNTFQEEMVEVSFISSVTKVKKDNFYIGLEFKLKPGWKIYWRQPGDSGMPPELDNSESINLKSLKLKWPFPIKEYEAANLLTNIYKDEVIIPLEVEAKDYTKPLYLKSILNFQVCKDICIPLKTNLFLKLDSGKVNFTNNFYKIEKALSKVPIMYTSAGINNITINKYSNESLLLNIESSVDLPEGDLEIFLENNGNYIKINNFIIQENLNNKIKVKLLLDNNIENLNSLDIIVVKGNLAASSKDILIENNPASSIYMILMIAFIGGLILNFMPCVLPVLVLKINRILSNNYETRNSIRFNFLLTSLGIIFSFIFIAFITLLIKNISGQVGWGIQFQQPIFLFFLITILFIFALNLFDLVNINLPNKLNNNILKFLGSRNSGVAFFEGALATLLATPCSAPFLGTAVGYALSSNFVITLLIFVFLGIGMSVPYLVLILFPSLVMFLPKPGKWMIYLRYLLGLGLFLTGIWLCFVCISVIGLVIFSYFVSLLFILLLIIKKLYLKKKYIGLILLLILSNIYLSYNAIDLEKVLLFNNQKEWIKFDNEELLKLINNGNTVFIDITADWCITCKANKILVLNNKKFNKLITENNIILMKGDWTKPNSEINKFLQNANRYGIPFNALYNSKFANGIIFSELLSMDEIRLSIDKLQGSYAK